MIRPPASTPGVGGFGLVRLRECWVPTWKGSLLLLLLLGMGVTLGIRGLHPFLAVTDRVETPVLVLEGWTPDFVAQATLAEFSRGHYERVWVTGGAIEKGQPLVEWKSWAEVGGATLARIGFPTNRLTVVPGQAVDRDRTFNSALALRDLFRREGRVPSAIQVVSDGPHGRRTRLLFEAAFGPATQVGIISVPDPRYPPDHWWINSLGFRDVIGEAVAYVYGRFLFRP